jgi:putative DNA-invertase from lambdoid prophage Rac
MTTNVKAALYLRVSKKDGSQSVENQRPDVEKLAAARGFHIVEVYEDRESAVRRRPAFERMMADAKKGRFQILIIWGLDRLGRGFTCFDAFRALAFVGVKVVSVKEPWTEADGPALELLAAIMSWVSGFERQRLIERTRAGLDRARAQGKAIGRPRVRIDVPRALALRERGLGLREAAQKLGIGASTLSRALRAHDALTACADKGHVGGALQPRETTMAA